ncbi:MAG: GAK system CofD-like protein [Deltaproteobacteria bacterium]|nr:GAK system CofD-like protein [Deltaproteobacteria bacterium]
MTSLSIDRRVRIPDRVRLERYRRSPDLGPAILFFSGGTALRETSRRLVAYTHNSIHLITPFDSGGSSAELRRAFAMPAIGDIRNRLMALADQSLLGNPAIFRLFAHRFPKDGHYEILVDELRAMAAGEHSLVAEIVDPMRKIIRRSLETFLQRMPRGFRLQGASIGNLILAAGYLENGGHLDPVIYLFSMLVQVRGTVRAVVNSDLDLVAELENGERIVGQHLLTGKEAGPISSPVRDIYLADKAGNRAEVEIRDKIRALIDGADLICYPMGSFYSSLVAPILPRGVGRAVGANPCPKVFVPGTVPDPECPGMSVEDQVRELLRYLKQDDEGLSNDAVLKYVLLDTRAGRYQGKVERLRLHQHGVMAIDASLVSPESSPFIDPGLLTEALLSLT